MIILQTGVPGSGKTSSIVNLLMNDDSYTHFTDKDGVKKKRPLFVNGIPELDLEHVELTDEQIKEQPFQDFLPYGSLVIIDEAQRLMGTRSAAREVPKFIQALATHRHHGLDIVLITQHPSFLDSFVRRLVQRHMHISIKPVGRKLYEWNECIDQPDSPTNVARAVERTFVVPKSTFGKYKSAEVHTKPKRRLPRSLIFLLIFVPIALIFAYNSVGRLASKYSGDDEQIQSVQSSEETVKPAESVKASSQNQVLDENAMKASDLVPTIPNRPESKPIFNEIRQVEVLEWPDACLKWGDSCNCYTNQGTKIKDIDKATCNEYIAEGMPFNPYKKQDNARERGGVKTDVPPNATIETAAEVLVMGGKPRQNIMYDGYVEAGEQFR